MTKTACVKTVKKLEGEFDVRLSYDISNGKVWRLRCETCSRWEKHISSNKSFSSNWVRPVTENVAKDSVKKHVDSIQDKEAKKMKTKSDLGAAAYKENVLENTLIGESLLKLNSEDKEGLRLKIKTPCTISQKTKIHSPTIQKER